LHFDKRDKAEVAFAVCALELDVESAAQKFAPRVVAFAAVGIMRARKVPGPLEAQLHFAIGQGLQTVIGKGRAQDVTAKMFATLFVVAMHACSSVKVKAPLLCAQASFGFGASPFIADHHGEFAIAWCSSKRNQGALLQEAMSGDLRPNEPDKAVDPPSICLAK
jgi:hypothetical protein